VVLLSVEKMSLITLTGPVRQLDAAIHRFVINREFHLENAAQALSTKMFIKPVIDASNPYLAALNSAKRCAELLDIPLGYADFSKIVSPQSAADSLRALSGEVEKLVAERDAARRAAQDAEATKIPIAHLMGIDEKLINLLNMKYVKFRYGKMHTEEYFGCLEDTANRNDVFVIATSIGTETTYLMYFVLPQNGDEADALFYARGFAKIPIDLGLKEGGTAAEVTAELERREAEAKARAEELDGRLREISAENKESFLINYSCVRFYSDSFALRAMAARRLDRFFLIGWIPADKTRDFTEECESGGVYTCFAADAYTIDYIRPPTKLRTPAISRLFEPFLKMYGMPVYTETDPALFMTATYMLFFGMMFGDIGQGLCLAVAGLFVWLKLKNWLGGIMTCCGLSGTVFGFVYGSIFGNEDILPGFKILHGQNVTILLLASLTLGIIMLGAVMLLGIINSSKHKRWDNLLFGANGIAGFVFYYGIITAAVLRLTLGINLFRLYYTLPVLILPLLLIMLREPVWLLISKNPELKHIKLGGVISVGFFELFETVLSYLTNTLSFLRIGAYAITHVGLMLVIQMLAGENQNIIVHILGNIFVIGFEGLLVGIQVLRLEFYELFGRFYDGGGKPFEPKTIDYSS